MISLTFTPYLLFFIYFGIYLLQAFDGKNQFLLEMLLPKIFIQACIEDGKHLFVYWEIDFFPCLGVY